MACRAEPTDLAGTMPTSIHCCTRRSGHARNIGGEVAASHEPVDDFWKHAVERLIVPRIGGHEAIKVRVKAFPQRRGLGLARAKRSRDHSGRA